MVTGSNRDWTGSNKDWTGSNRDWAGSNRDWTGSNRGLAGRSRRVKSDRYRPKRVSVSGESTAHCPPERPRRRKTTDKSNRWNCRRRRAADCQLCHQHTLLTDTLRDITHMQLTLLSDTTEGVTVSKPCRSCDISEPQNTHPQNKRCQREMYLK